MSDYPGFRFEILQRDAATQARLGCLTTPHGSLPTPNFIFCATRAAIKGAGPEDVRAVGADIILSNTYHLMLLPGPDLVEKMGGLHAFMQWDGPMLTDSGGFQVFSLGYGSVSDEIKGKRNMQFNRSLKKVTEEGAAFRSYLDGSLHMLSPERSMEVQRKLGADLILIMDECTPFHVEQTHTERSMRRTHRWADRCLAEFERTHTGRQALYGISQGGVYADLRHESSEFMSSRPFFGHAIGGSLGASKEQMYAVVGLAMQGLCKERPVHLLGIGGPDDIWANVAQGVDTFDCVSPTRIARHGWALARTAEKFRLNLFQAQYREDPGTLDPECDCSTCRAYSRAYLHYLFKAKELQGMHLLTIHNMRFMVRLLTTIRDAIRDNCFLEARQAWLSR